jgi:uncharacterized protein
MGNPFVHLELLSSDLQKSKEFYQSLFDWKIEDVPGMEYTMIKVGEGTGGGMMKVTMPDMPSHWLAYVLVDDVNIATEKAKTLGANIVNPVTEIPNIGRFSVLVDPTGAALALWQPLGKM